MKPNGTPNDLSDLIAVTDADAGKSVVVGSDGKTFSLVALASAIETLINKTVNLASNTLTGTTAQFNAALSDNDFATLAGAETLTNKTIDGSNNTVTNVLKSGTLINTTSGTSHTFSGLPAGVKLIHLMLSQVSTNGVAGLAVQIGDSGGLEVVGYASNSGASVRTDGFVLTAATAAAELHNGVVTFALVNSATNLWAMSGAIGNGVNVNHVSSGIKSLSGTLDRIALTAIGDTFDGGSINLLYEI
jgi:hypothetical protein